MSKTCDIHLVVCEGHQPNERFPVPQAHLVDEYHDHVLNHIFTRGATLLAATLFPLIR